jgi:hypothetical protein
MDTLKPECVHCQGRIAALERVSISHEAKLMLHAESLDELERKLDNLGASNKRIEELLERVLSFVTPNPKMG